jgi:hypothetical protein
VEAVTAPGDPYGEPFRVGPQAGLLVIFPSWLYHWVHPYAGETPRVAISFNAAVPTSAETNSSSHKGTGVGAAANENSVNSVSHLNPISH